MNQSQIKALIILNTNTSNEANNENNVLKNLRLTNSLRNKFELLTEMVWEKVDLLMISETKLDFSFPNAQFYMKSHSQSYRLDKNSKGGGIILYVREDIPSKLINSLCTNHGKEYLLVELNLRNQKGLKIVTIIPIKPGSRDI